MTNARLRVGVRRRFGFSAEKNPVHTYTAAGTYTASLTVTDARGGKTTKTVQITVTSVAGAAPAAEGPDRRLRRRRSWFGVSEPVKTSVSGFAKSGLAVKVTATEAMSGSAKLLVSSKVAKALGLKSTTLASVTALNCAAGGKSVTLKPSAAVKRALKKAKGSVKVTLNVRPAGGGGAVHAVDAHAHAVAPLGVENRGGRPWSGRPPLGFLRGAALQEEPERCRSAPRRSAGSS